MSETPRPDPNEQARRYFNAYRQTHLAGCNVGTGYLGSIIKKHISELPRDQMAHIWVDGAGPGGLLILGRNGGDVKAALHFCYFGNGIPSDSDQLPDQEEYYIIPYAELARIPDDSGSWEQDSTRLSEFKVTEEDFLRYVAAEAYLRH